MAHVSWQRIPASVINWRRRGLTVVIDCVADGNDRMLAFQLKYGCVRAEILASRSHQRDPERKSLTC